MPDFRVSRVLKNKKFLELVKVHRKSGDWVRGRFEENEDTFDSPMVVVSTSTKDIIQVPEGDRLSEQKTFYSTIPLFVSQYDATRKGTSDVIEWKGQKYRIYQVNDWGNYGYYKAIGVRTGGE